jgi:hypothetical protein
LEECKLGKFILSLLHPVAEAHLEKEEMGKCVDLRDDRAKKSGFVPSNGREEVFLQTKK